MCMRALVYVTPTVGSFKSVARDEVLVVTVISIHVSIIVECSKVRISSRFSNRGSQSVFASRITFYHTRDKGRLKSEI